MFLSDESDFFVQGKHKKFVGIRQDEQLMSDWPGNSLDRNSIETLRSMTKSRLKYWIATP